MTEAPPSLPEPERREQKHNLLKALGPGLITGASDDDPSGIATYSQVGAQFGYGLLWAMLFSYPLMATIQEISGRLGRVTGHGIAGNMRRAYAPVWLWLVTALLIIANVINLGADIGAMGEAVRLLVGGPALLYAALFAVLSVLLQVFVPYSRYAQILKWLSASLLAYVATVFVVHVPWGQALRATLLPHFSVGASSIQALVAVLGTTISPYLFFWQASEEVSDMDTHVLEHPLKEDPQEAREQFRRIRSDTFIGMAFSNLVAFFIILTAAVVLHAHGQTDIQTASQAAEALRPIAGRFAFILFAAGLVGTGLLALPVLAGSAGYALGEALRWPVGLERKLYQARGFYAIIALSTLLGLGLVLVHIDPIKALYYSAIINGVAAAPVMLLLMLITANKGVMGEFTVKGWLRGLGWLGTGVMALAAAAMFATLGK
ncbi:divalent metal cation transporter [Deinococcus rubellus]|uniref:Nramp family divalent metal transporter n=1 Tax=Deinococcus rubellus TaxID=1889240 RepID=A0ABY5YFF2_9DEIO|nr:Nramp family divalent metal transporter [Deinococcus rubellus]UWX63565.1 Nramp family divalent metal transporter [Deinococcus rubellus]